MPTALTVRGLDEELVRRLKLRAARHGRSMEAECRDILRQALANEPQDFRALASSLRQSLADRAHRPAGDVMAATRAETWAALPEAIPAGGISGPGDEP
ncbi:MULTISPECIES: FitA-like ribbon-helix-helix domain-containing protein [Nitrospirillum]|uniref:Antitoxin FitA-like ribbon-helix-helix domain-containing protein n=1 Tax=Nitrospirillum amazonense TaxID=28077 RepID=A0A560FFX1_9PROT|nr:hypothetical protein [Nitrospirillum amazonense]MEC4595054.1 hypothetical protein [Nitrospirillum amazonense]TWB20510.1 hypothetical protein FBZ88_1214 [Nitrospirillum amazonense]